jgi:hypothetical protein
VTRSFGAWVIGGLVACTLAGCNLVLGIDDVSSANGPDSGQRVSSATADPDAGAPGDADEDSGPPAEE